MALLERRRVDDSGRALLSPEEALGLLDWAARQAALEAQNAGPDDEPRPRTQRRRVRCDGCSRTTPLLTAHRVGRGWIGDACCWPQHQARRTA